MSIWSFTKYLNHQPRPFFNVCAGFFYHDVIENLSQDTNSFLSEENHIESLWLPLPYADFHQPKLELTKNMSK